MADKIVQFKTHAENEREKCIRILKDALTAVETRDPVGVAVVMADKKGKVYTNWISRDGIRLLGGLARIMSDINRLMDHDEDGEEGA